MFNNFNFNQQTTAGLDPHLFPFSTLAKCIVGLPELTLVDIDVIE